MFFAIRRTHTWDGTYTGTVFVSMHLDAKAPTLGITREFDSVDEVVAHPRFGSFAWTDPTSDMPAHILKVAVAD